MSYVVVCRDANSWGPGAVGPYVLATRRIFPSKEAALAYATGIAVGLQPLIVFGGWHELYDREPAVAKNSTSALDEF